jgi:hypothetical protein
MTLNDTILASIEAELAVLKNEEAAPAPTAAPTPEPAAPTPAPVVEADVPPVIRWAREEAAKHQAK